MSSVAIRSFLASEPHTLGALEAALGVRLARDVTGSEAWLVRRDNPIPGVTFLFVALVGPNLAASADPMLDEVRLFTAGTDLRAEAIALLGPGEVRGGEEHRDIYHGTTTRTPLRSAWSRRLGVLEIHEDATQLFWQRHEGDYEAAWEADEEAAVLWRISELCAGPLDDARLERAFSTLVMGGRHTERFRRGPTWKLAVQPIQGPRPTRATLTLNPPLPLDRVLWALGSPPALVSTAGVQQDSTRVVERATRGCPVRSGTRIDIRVASLDGATRSDVELPAQRAYETTGLLASDLTFEVPKRLHQPFLASGGEARSYSVRALALLSCRALTRSVAVTTPCPRPPHPLPPALLHRKPAQGQGQGAALINARQQRTSRTP
jgi:hypothetical protein